jgi:acyl carrier protein
LDNLSENIQELLAQALQLPIEQIPLDLAFGDIPQWDSMGHMEVMMILEERYGVEINADTISALTSIPIIYEYLQKRSDNI